MKRPILSVVHDGVSELHEIGAVDAMTMRKFDALCQAEIDKIAKDNPDLTTEVIQGVLLATDEIKSGEIKRYIRRVDRD